MILDGALIRRRRQELALSHRELARSLGVTSIVVFAAEKGTNHDALSLGFVVKLAAALAVDVVDLVGGSAAVAGADEPALTATEALGEALGSRSERRGRLWDILRQCCRRRGWCLQRRGADVAIRAQAGTSSEVRQELWRRHDARRGADTDRGEVLFRVMCGQVDEGKLSNPDRVALNRLRRAGLVSDEVRPCLTEDVEVGLSV
jgi:transcriptional regulator with XRE-family HTH domain